MLRNDTFKQFMNDEYFEVVEVVEEVVSSHQKN